MTDRNCGKCRFYQIGQPFSDGTPAHDGECRRHAPTQHRQTFPRVYADSWCGEFEEAVVYDVQLEPVERKPMPQPIKTSIAAAPVTRPAETEATVAPARCEHKGETR